MELRTVTRLGDSRPREPTESSFVAQFERPLPIYVHFPPYAFEPIQTELPSVASSLSYHTIHKKKEGILTRLWSLAYSFFFFRSRDDICWASWSLTRLYVHICIYALVSSRLFSRLVRGIRIHSVFSAHFSLPIQFLSPPKSQSHPSETQFIGLILRGIRFDQTCSHYRKVLTLVYLLIEDVVYLKFRVRLLRSMTSRLAATLFISGFNIAPISIQKIVACPLRVTVSV